MTTEKKEDWMEKKWRPAMGWMYMCVCAFDFIGFPILWSVIQFWEVMPENDAFRQWNPLTLQGAGLFHVAMGAVLGVTAWSRGQEKMASINNPSPVSPPSLPTPTNQFSQPVQQFNVPPQSFDAPRTTGYVSPKSQNVQMTGETYVDSKGRLKPQELDQPEL